MLQIEEKKYKILYVVEAMGGGVFTYIVDLANELVEHYDIYIAYAIRKQTPLDYEEYFDKRINLIKVVNFERSINVVKDINAFFEIRRIAKSVNPDIIHLHSSKAGALGRWAFDGKTVPIFYTPHGYSFLMRNQSIFKRILYKAVEKMSASRNCITISCSEGEHRETLKITKRATFVNNGINIAELQKLVDSIKIENEHRFTVFTLGRICYQKNPKLFNEIALEMPNVRFVWIGDGELRHELSAPNIEITGWCEREEALRQSLKCDVFLLTSLWEGLPISLLEAMYIKHPCVVSDVIGNRDVIKNGENGFVCKNKNEFVEAIKKTQESENNALIDKAYSDILELYNTKIMAMNYCKIYEKNIVI